MTANFKPSWVRVLAALVCSVLVACGNDDDPTPPPPTEGSATLGAAGGTVDGPDGVQMVVPADALASPVTFRLARDGTGARALEGLNAVSPVYAVTPHGQVFDAPGLLSLPLSAAQVPPGAKPFVMKAEPGGPWRVLSNVSPDPTRLAVDLDSLSFFLLGVCSSSVNDIWTINGVDCPANHELKLALLDSGGQDIDATRVGSTGLLVVPPWVVRDTEETRFFKVRWRRPPSTQRTDQLAIVGTPGGFNSTGFRTNWGTPAVRNVNDNEFTTTFSVTIDPARVPGANGPNGRRLQVTALASYDTVAFRLGQGNVPVGFSFETWVPILVLYGGPQPVITQQPANVGVTAAQPASFSVVATGGTLTYQWARRANANASFAVITGATAASYAIAAAQLADDGAQFQVQVCLAPTRCVTSIPATLNVTQAPVVPAFSAQPTDVAVAAGQTASFSATATGTPLPQLRWQSAAPGSTFSDVAGVAACGTTNPPGSGTSVTANCTVGPLTVGDSGQRYRAVAINAASPAGVISNVATLTVAAAPVAPAITQQPAAQSTSVGGSATFSVTATGTAPLNYAWGTLNGGVLPSMTGNFTIGSCSGQITYSNGGATLTLSNLTISCSGFTVTVTVSNGVNPSATSTGATLTVNAVATAGACLAGSNGWCYSRPLPQANGLLGLVYENGVFTAVGPGGTTLRTSDAGGNWQATFDAARTDWYDMARPASGLLVAAGMPRSPTLQNSGVFTSADGGLTWTRRLDAGMPGQIALSKVAFANASLGLAAGFGGVWRTADGGATWVAVAGVPSRVVSAYYGGIAWVNGSTALIYGAQGALLRSTDAGLTWVDVSAAGLVENYYDLSFNSAGVGIAVGGAGQVARSTNFGATWQAVATGMSTNTHANAVAFADANTVVVLGGLFEVARSTDAGQTWTAGFRPGDSNQYRLRFASATLGIAVGANGGQILRTTDGGENWSIIGGGTFDLRVTGLATSPSGNVVLAGAENGALLRSTTAGATWAGAGVNYTAPAFATDQVAIAIRPAGQIVRSTDAGQTWSVTYNQLGAVRLSATTMATTILGFVVGDNGLILRTTDGGQSWGTVPSGSTAPLRAVGCLSSTVCLTGGSVRELLRSTDGGATWSTGSMPLGSENSGVHTITRISNTVAVIAADDGLWRSTDAGQTWTRAYTSAGGSQLAVSFNGAGVGIAVGNDGVRRSTDQGLSWVRQDLPISYQLFATTWINATTVLIGGDGGALLRNLQGGVE